MYIYSVTFAVDRDIETEFKQYITNRLRPLQNEDLIYSSARFSRVLTDDDGHLSYNLQLSVIDINEFRKNENTNWLCKELQSKFGDKVLCFQTMLKIENDFF